jgi:molecular chaperone GrpE
MVENKDDLIQNQDSEENLENIESENIDLPEENNSDDLLKDEIIKALENQNIKLKERNEKVEKDVKEIKERYIRTLADIDNLRKRTKKEIEDMKKYAITSLLKDFLPVVDNLKRAIDHVSEEEKKGNPLVEGVILVYKQFQDALDKNSVKSFESLNEIFDPTKHEALQMVENDELPNNTVITEYEKGYFIGDRLLRPAKVIVSKKTNK